MLAGEQVHGFVGPDTDMYGGVQPVHHFEVSQHPRRTPTPLHSTSPLPLGAADDWNTHAQVAHAQAQAVQAVQAAQAHAQAAAHAQAQYASYRHLTPIPTDSPQRKSSEGSEVEASMALSGLGLALPHVSHMLGSTIKRRDEHSPRVTPTTQKKLRKDDKPAKDTRKSCAECRRLKAKCDRVFPCSNCRRRGCAVVCPDGDLSCMQGKRLVLASTEKLHDRIAQLEAALFQAHSKVDTEAHPLLAPQYLDGGFANLPSKTPPLISRTDSPPFTELKMEGGRRSSSPGTYSFTPSRVASGGRLTVDALLLSDEIMARESDWIGENSTPAQFLLTPDQGQNRPANAIRLAEIMSVLPPREETGRHAARFWVQSGWYQHILTRDEFETVYEPAVYSPTQANPISPHKLSIVLIVLMMDSFFDLTRETEDPKVAMYWDAVQRCFDTRFGWAASVAGVQALTLITYFVGFGWKGASASNFYWVRRMTTAVQQLGMHKEPHPLIEFGEAEFRRRVFWESFVCDGLMSINHGQRTAIPIENIECRYPNVSTRLTTRYEYMRRVNYNVLDLGLRPDSNPASPEQIRACEEEHMKFNPSRVPSEHCPALVNTPMPEPRVDLTSMEPLDLANTANSTCYYKCLLFLYRPALRRLVGRMRSNPDVKFSAWDHKVATTTMETCRHLITAGKYFSRRQPRLAGRTWTTWVQIFSAAVSMSALAVWCSPHMDPSFLAQAYHDLEEVRQLIEGVSSDRANSISCLMPALQGMVAGRYPHLVGQDASAVCIHTQSEDMLFGLLGGEVSNYGPPGLMSTESMAPFPFVAPSMPTPVPTQPSQAAGLRPVAAGSQTPRQNSGSSGSAVGSGGSLSPVDWTTTPPDASVGSNVDWNTMSNYMVLPPQQTPAPARSAPTPGRFQSSLPTPPMPDNSMMMQAATPGVGDDSEPLSTTELWARLQTFYEPTVWWGLGDGYDVMPPVRTPSGAGSIPQTMQTGMGMATPVFTPVPTVPMGVYHH